MVEHKGVSDCGEEYARGAKGALESRTVDPVRRAQAQAELAAIVAPTNGGSRNIKSA